MRLMHASLAVLAVSAAAFAKPVAPELPDAGLPPNAALDPSKGPAAIAADVPRLIAQLAAPDWQLRDAATRALIALGNPARQALRKAAKSHDPEVRWRARYALSRLHDALALPPPNLARALYRSAALARTRKDGLETARRLYKEVAERFPKTKWAAAARERLARLDRKPAATKAAAPLAPQLERLVGQLASPNWRSRQEASHRLARLGKAARAALERAAKSADRELAWRARSLLKRLEAKPSAAERSPRRGPVLRLEFGGMRRAIRPGASADLDRLADTLASPDRDRVEAARDLLLNSGDAAVGPLIRALDRCNEVTSVEIADLLRQITGEKLGFDPERWKAWRRAQRSQRKD